MKKLSLSALAFAAALFAVSSAHADTTPGWYVGAGLGGTFAAQDDVKVPGARYNGDYDPNVRFPRQRRLLPGPTACVWKANISITS